MIKKIILTDCDGVLLNWLDTFIEYMKDEGFTVHTKEPSQYDLGNFFKIPLPEIYKRIQLFNDGHWRFGTLQSYDDVQESISVLASLGYSFVAVTSCSDLDQVADLRKANLYNVFGDVFEEVHCIGIHNNKRAVLENYEPTFWIEDRFSHALEGAKAGHKAILLDQPWNINENDPRVTRCLSWAEIVEYILTSQ